MWGNGIMIVGGLVILVGIINLLILVEFPSEKGIVIEEDSNIFSIKQEQSTEALTNTGPKNSISFLGALRIPGVLLFAMSFFFIKFSMYGFYYWLPSYLQECLLFSKDTSANIFSLFGVGAICGNLLMGLSTDLLPLRSPVFLLGILISALATLTLSLWASAATAQVGLISFVIFVLGAALTGCSIIIAAIECDLGRQEALANNHRALATVSGIIDGIAGFGSILGQLMIGVVVHKAGWRPTFVMLAGATALSGVPAGVFAVREYREWRAKRQMGKKQRENEDQIVSN
jgi:OPA family glycerol-3-phosphate transporter-like MFS transporter 1/2